MRWKLGEHQGQAPHARFMKPACRVCIPSGLKIVYMYINKQKFQREDLQSEVDPQKHSQPDGDLHLRACKIALYVSI